MNIVFRADASTETGYGHVTRCLALGQELMVRGHRVAFLCRPAPGDLIDYLRGHKLPVHGISPQAESASLDAEESVAAVPRLLGAPVDWMVVDHYGLDRAWHSAMRPAVKHLMVIDDLADREHDCDVLLDQNLFDHAPARYSDKVSRQCKQLLGPRYALLRRDFANARRHLRPRLGAAERLLVFFGGGDVEGLTDITLNALAGRTADIVVGAGNPRRDAIRARCDGETAWRFHCQVDNMAELVAAADIALGAGGSATWERCCLGLPALACVVADNQTAIAASVAAQGAHIDLGWWEDLTVEDWRAALDSLTAATLREMSERGMELVDGLGCERVAATLECIGEHA